MPPLLIQNGRVIDPSQDMDRVTSVLVADGRILTVELPASVTLTVTACDPVLKGASATSRSCRARGT